MDVLSKTLLAIALPLGLVSEVRAATVRPKDPILSARERCLAALAARGNPPLLSGHNDVEMFFFGMRRSGNHAVLHWLAETATAPSGTYVFLNNSLVAGGRMSAWDILVRARGQTLLAEEVHVPVEAREGVDFTRKEQRVRLMEDAEAELLRAHVPTGRRDLLLRSFEDTNVPADFDLPWQGRRLGASGKVFFLVLLRDPYNLFASRLAAVRKGLFFKMSDHTVQMWKRQARLFAANGGNLVLHEDDRGAILLVNFNRWFSDRAYRASLARAVGRELDDTVDAAARNHLPANGGGSSFSGMARAGQAASLPVLTSYRNVADDPEYRGYFDAEVRALAETIFGLTAPW